MVSCAKRTSVRLEDRLLCPVEADERFDATNLKDLELSSSDRTIRARILVAAGEQLDRAGARLR